MKTNVPHLAVVFLCIVAITCAMSCDREKDAEFCDGVTFYSGEKPEDYACLSLEDARRRWQGTEAYLGYIQSFESGPVKKVLGPDRLKCCYQVKVTENP